jgi:hypothetical protein
VAEEQNFEISKLSYETFVLTNEMLQKKNLRKEDIREEWEIGSCA